MCLCGHSRRCHLVTFFAESARHRWIDKVNANMDKDCSHYPELRNAPVNTDTTESGLGGLDYNLYKTLAAFTTTFGLVQAQRMQIFASESGKVDRENKRRLAKDHVEISTKWKLTSYYDMPATKRAAVLRIINKGFKENLVLAPKRDEVAQETSHFKSKLQARDRYLNRQMKRLIYFRRYKDVPLYTHETRDAFKDQWNIAGRGLGITEKNRFASDQLRVRLHCYGVLAKDMPKFSNIPPGIKGAAYFLATVMQYMKACGQVNLTQKLPVVGSHREVRANLDISAEKVDHMFALEIESMSRQFLEDHPEGVFIAYRFQQPQHINTARRYRRVRVRGIISQPFIITIK